MVQLTSAAGWPTSYLIWQNNARSNCWQSGKGSRLSAHHDCALGCWSAIRQGWSRVGNSGCSQVKSRRGKGGQEVLPRVGSSVIHLQVEGIWAVYSICIKNKDLVTPWRVIYQDGDFNEKLRIMQDEDSLLWDRSKDRKSNCLWSVCTASS